MSLGLRDAFLAAAAPTADNHVREYIPSVNRAYRVCRMQQPETIMKSDEFQRQIDDEKVEGWKVKQDGDERVVMAKPNYGSGGGHLVVALLTVWWTLGIGNLLYLGYKYFSDSPSKVVRDESASASETTADATVPA